MNLKLKKRIADTLVEVIIAMAAFGIIMSGTFDFMANQTLAMVKMRERDDVDFWAQLLISRAGSTDVYVRNMMTSEDIKIITPTGISSIKTDYQTLHNELANSDTLVIQKGSTKLTYKLK